MQIQFSSIAINNHSNNFSHLLHKLDFQTSGNYNHPVKCMNRYNLSLHLYISSNINLNMFFHLSHKLVHIMKYTCIMIISIFHNVLKKFLDNLVHIHCNKFYYQFHRPHFKITNICIYFNRNNHYYEREFCCNLKNNG